MIVYFVVTISLKSILIAVIDDLNIITSLFVIFISSIFAQLLSVGVMFWALMRLRYFINRQLLMFPNERLMWMHFLLISLSLTANIVWATFTTRLSTTPSDELTWKTYFQFEVSYTFYYCIEIITVFFMISMLLNFTKEVKYIKTEFQNVETEPLDSSRVESLFFIQNQANIAEMKMNELANSKKDLFNNLMRMETSKYVQNILDTTPTSSQMDVSQRSSSIHKKYH